VISNFKTSLRFESVVGMFNRADAHKMTAFIRRKARYGFVPADSTELTEIGRTADETLFSSQQSQPTIVSRLSHLS
jgi:hypothetical protein